MKATSILTLIVRLLPYALLFLGILQNDVNTILVAGIFLILGSISDLEKALKNKSNQLSDDR